MMVKNSPLFAIVMAFAAGAGCLVSAQPALAGPAAIVEDIKGKVAGLDVMDYVEPGQNVQLLPNDMLVLGYLKSCVRETIRGGLVKIGETESKIDGGKVVREKFACDGQKIALTSQQAGKSGAMVLRKLPDPVLSKQGASESKLTIYSTSPAVVAPSSGRLLIERIDLAEQPRVFDLPSAKTDLAKLGVKLAPGGTYRAALGETKIIFAVDPKARATAGPLAGRLLQF